MKKLYLSLIALCTIVFVQLNAQDRYLEEVFTDAEIQVTSDIHYATNATILGLLFDPNIDEFIPEPLFMDVYEPDPSIDTVSNRPVVMVVHGGDALPRLANNACWGDKLDSVTVVTAKKLARMGYVAVAPNYRLGWNPLTTTQDLFLDGLVDAGVRVQQDLKACARWLRKDVAEDGNTYNIDADQIAIWGTASTAGTYAGFAAYINELEETQTPTWFVTDEDGNVYNTFNLMEAGNLDGTEVGVNALGDTTNYVNTPGYSSRFQLAALGSGISLDPGTIDADEPPMIMFGNPNSPVTQFPEGPIQLPTTGEVVAFAQLSQGMITEANEVGVNDAWINANPTDVYTTAQQADPNFGAQEGWLPLYGDPDNEYPWVWWDTLNCPLSAESFDVLPGANRDMGLLQIDTMAGYFGVRACITFGLGCPGFTSTKEVVLDESLVNIAPNPTEGGLTVEATAGKMIEDIRIMTINGQEMGRYRVDNHYFQVEDLKLTPGFYLALVRFEDGVVPKKIVVR